MADRETNVTNAYESTLAAELSAVAGSAELSDATGLTAPFYLVIEPDDAGQREYVYVSALAGTTATLDERYLSGSAAASGLVHPVGAVVRHAFVAQHLVDINDRVDAAGDHSQLTNITNDDHHTEDHAARHADGGADEIEVEGLPTADTDVSRALRPDGAGGVAFSDVAHVDLSGLTANDHHARSHSHSGLDGSGTVAHSDTTGQGVDDHHARDHNSRHLPGGADDIGWPGNFEVDGHTEVGSSGALSGSFSTVASVTLSIPAGWNSWKCVAFASYGASGSSTDRRYEVKVVIDGASQQVKAALQAESLREDGAIGGRRVGMTTTGNRSIALQARETTADVQLEDIYLYARAIRTS